MTARQRELYLLAADCIFDWLQRDCEVVDEELTREVVEDLERGWMDPVIEA